jgi:RNA recognition motif-containing protein
MNIYVGNLSSEVTEEDLRQAFEGLGQVVSVNIIKDRYSGESRGFGFVEMPDKAEAQSAINGLVAEEDMVVAEEDKVVGDAPIK